MTTPGGTRTPCQSVPATPPCSAHRLLSWGRSFQSAWPRPFVVDRNICNFLCYGGVEGGVGEGLRSVGVVPILQPGACALSCPSLAVYRAGAFGLRPLYCPWSRCFSLHYQGNAAYALRPLCVARDLGWCECNYPRWGGHTSESTVTTLPVLGAPTSIMGRSSHGGYVTGLRPFALPRSYAARLARAELCR